MILFIIRILYGILSIIKSVLYYLFLIYPTVIQLTTHEEYSKLNTVTLALNRSYNQFYLNTVRHAELPYRLSEQHG
jgi:hypothetical protein